MLTVLSVAFPFAPVTVDPIGGAEQVLAHLDRALVSAGHRSIVIAAEGSQSAGTLVPVPRATQPLNEAARKSIHVAVRETIIRVLEREPVDVVHLHGIDFESYLPPPGPPVLVTLHMPIDWYTRTALETKRPKTWLHPVSASQARTVPAHLKMLPPIGNGVAIPQSSRPVRKRGFALALGRICPEKGFHLAIEASVRANIPLLIGGEVFPWPEHQRYFERDVLPRLDCLRRWIGPLIGRRKQWLLCAARCVLVPSLVCETSSLVAMEALAAGTPVIAYRSGALPDIVDHGTTGYIVDDVAAMAESLHMADRIDPEHCRLAARERFALDRAIAEYFSLYRRIAASEHELQRTDHSWQWNVSAESC
jgi:glycosyltransferase involved in cell wall biosynthesis